jgi:hypothetical protein
MSASEISCEQMQNNVLIPFQESRKLSRRTEPVQRDG